MAEVYVAKTKGIGGFEKLVAIKVIHPRFSEDEHFVEMLVEEAKISVQLTHVNIAQTFDLGCIDRTYFIAMEFIDGADTYRVKHAAARLSLPLPIDAATYIVAQVLAGLGYAHRKCDANGEPLSIVHRDVSPQNILVSYTGEVKLVDFGIAKAASRGGQTEVGVIKGKYYYMSPEQAWADPVDGRTDVFSAGLVLHELLTGQMVYPEESIPKVLDRVRKAQVPNPRERRPEISAELAAIVMKACAREPDHRFVSAEDFSQALIENLYEQHPTFTTSRLAQLMGTLFPEETRAHSGPVPLPSGPRPPAASDDADRLPAMSAGEFAPSAKDSVIFDLEEVEEKTMPPTRRVPPPPPPGMGPNRKLPSSVRPANNGPSARQVEDTDEERAARDDWEEETFLKEKGEWNEETMTGGDNSDAPDGLDGLFGAPRELGDDEPEELEGERTLATVSPFADDSFGDDDDFAGSPDKTINAAPAFAHDDDDPATAATRPPGPPPPPPADLPIEKTMALSPGALPNAQRPQAQVAGGGIRLGPDAARFFPGGPQPNPAAAPVPAGYPYGPPAGPPPGPPPGAPPGPPPGAFGPPAGPPPGAPPGPPPSYDPFGVPAERRHAYAPGQDPFAARPQPQVSAAALGKPQPIKWILPIAALGFVVILIAGTIGWVAGLPDDTTLSIDSMPAGATVRLDSNTLSATTPTVIEDLQPGQTVALELSHPGYETSSVEITLDEGANSRMVLLNPVRATIRVMSDPPGAQVWVNNVLRGAAPLNVGGLSIGETVEIRATAPRRGPLTQRVTVTERSTELTLTLPAIE